MSDTTVSYGVLGNHFPAPEECVGYGVYDPLGQKIGTVDDLFVNAYDEPEHVRVRMGFLGLRRILILH